MYKYRDVILTLAIGSFFWILWQITPKTGSSILLVFAGIFFFLWAVQLQREI